MYNKSIDLTYDTMERLGVTLTQRIHDDGRHTYRYYITNDNVEHGPYSVEDDGGNVIQRGFNLNGKVYGVVEEYDYTTGKTVDRSYYNREGYCFGSERIVC
jgi:hypothetical protein